MKKIKFEIKPVLYFVIGLVLGMALMFPYDTSKAVNDNKLIKLNYSEYQELKNKNEKNIVMIGRDSCGWCQKYIPILSKIVKDKEIKIYYLDTDKLTNEENTSLNDSDSLFTSEEFGTPTIILVQNNKITNYNIGYLEEKETINWLKEAGVLNGK